MPGLSVSCDGTSVYHFGFTHFSQFLQLKSVLRASFLRVLFKTRPGALILCIKKQKFKIKSGDEPTLI